MFTLDKVVPWGRSFDEYARMFALGGADLAGRILGCADGPASFNFEATRRGARVISCDPLYRWTTDQIRERIRVTSEDILDQTRRNRREFNWTSIQTPERLYEIRMAAMNAFLDDFAAGTVEGRYVDAELPSLPFDDGAFDLALCSHFLFLYSAQLGDAFHRDAVREMCRVAAEVRIFPLVMLGGMRSPHVDEQVAALRALGLESTVEGVDYEFQQGANQMLRIRRPANPVAGW